MNIFCVKALQVILLLSFFVVSEPHKITIPDTLTVTQSMQRDTVEKMVFLDLCCKSTLAACLQKKTTCTVALRLHSFATWLIARTSATPMISDEIAKRYESMTLTTKSLIDTTIFPIAGDKHAPVLITGYVSATCPLCHFITLELYDAVTKGLLLHKARFMIKPFGKSTGNSAYAAACKTGKFWEYVLAVSHEKARLDRQGFERIADSIGIDKNKFKILVDDTATSQAVEASFAEANKNSVTIAPTFFINHVRYKSFKDPEWIIDAALFKYESKSPSN